MASSKRDFERFAAWLHLPANQSPVRLRQVSSRAVEGGTEFIVRAEMGENFILETAYQRESSGQSE